MKSVTERSHGDCESAVLERPQYYPRQIVTPGDLTLEQTYFRDRLRRHNRLLHGWGVVCGAEVVIPPGKNGGDPEPWMITVTPGYVLGPYGDEIVIDCARTWDVRGGGLSGATGQPPVDYPDPWCSRVLEEQRGPVYIAVKYKEVPSRPVRVQPVGCGCGENQCVYSRWRDGYEFGVLTECPTSQLSPPEGQPNPDPGTEGEGSECPACPPCPSDPWVVLARIEFDADGTIVDLDNCACRRLVISFASKWNTCESAHAASYQAEPERQTAATTTSAPGQRAPEPATPSPEAAPRKTSRRRSHPEEPDTTQQQE